jgi:hypothetical protein
MPFAHRNHQVQAFPTNRADHAFAELIRLWRAHRCFQDGQAHRLKRTVNACRVDRVAIVDHGSMHLVARDDHPKLLRRPVCGRMRRDVPPENAPCADLRHHEHVHDAECRGDDDEEITRGDRPGVVPYECAPALCPLLRVPRNDGMYRRTVRGDTRMPSFSRSSLAMRSSPHVRFATAIVAISRCTSRAIAGRPGVRDFQRQNSRNPCRCQRISVSGFTISSN